MSDLPDAPADAVLWQEQVVVPSLPALGPWSTAKRVGVAIVGAGYAGLAAATELARGGRSVAVFEKGTLGWGAHSRNGGMAIPELKAGPAQLVKTYGELGRKLHADVNEAFDHLESMIARERIGCDYRRSGQLYLAHTPRLLPHLQALAAEHAEHGEPVRYVDREGLRPEIGSSEFKGGIVFDRTGALHPAKLHTGMARMAMTAGAELRDRCAVLGFQDRGAASTKARFLLETEHGQVEADHLIVTTNAYADAMLPELARRVLPIGSFIIATEPLAPAVAASVSPQGRMFVNTKNLLFYWRLSPDDRMVFGGRRSLGQTKVEDAGTYLAASMRRIHPQLEDVAVTHRWGGNVAMTMDRLPHVGQLRGAWYATGCNGSGVALNTWLGHRLAHVVLGEAAPPSFAQLRHRPIPFHRLRRAYLPLVSRWYEHQDRR